MLVGVGALIFAVTTYYVLVVFVGRRWNLGVDESGDAMNGLMSVGRALGFWLAGAVAGGLVLGYLAHLLKLGSPRYCTIALGVSFGLLAGEAAYTVGSAAFFWAGPFDSFMSNKLQMALLQLVLATGALLVGIRLRRHSISWPSFVGRCAGCSGQQRGAVLCR